MADLQDVFGLSSSCDSSASHPAVSSLSRVRDQDGPLQLGRAQDGAPLAQSEDGVPALQRRFGEETCSGESRSLKQSENVKQASGRAPKRTRRAGVTQTTDVKDIFLGCVLDSHQVVFVCHLLVLRDTQTSAVIHTETACSQVDTNAARSRPRYSPTCTLSSLPLYDLK